MVVVVVVVVVDEGRVRYLGVRGDRVSSYADRRRCFDLRNMYQYVQ